MSRSRRALHPRHAGARVPLVPIFVFSAILGLATVFPTRSLATFHLMVIDEVLTSYGGDPSVQFVELRMVGLGQNFVADTVLGVFDSFGGYLGDALVLPSDVPNSVFASRILMATSAFETLTGLAPDFVIPAMLETSGGMICWGAPGVIAPSPATWSHSNPASYVDCLAYGNYSGLTNVHVGTPTPLDGNGHSIQRSSPASSGNNAADFTCGDPSTPENNAAQKVSLQATAACPVCGNSAIESGEQCDDGNTTNGDGCDANCRTESCGDGTVNNVDEECDGGGESPVCDADCTFTVCGDGVVNSSAGEQCDVGNDAQCPGSCRADCSCPVPLAKPEQKCAKGLAKDSAKSVDAYGKEALFCVKAIAAGKVLPRDVLACVETDARGKIRKAQDKVNRDLDRFCSAVPYEMDCATPCDLADSGGSTGGIDDAIELRACLACVNPATAVAPPSAPGVLGLHGKVLDGVTIVLKAEDKSQAKCQAGVTKGYQLLLAARAKELAKCARGAYKAGVTPPVSSCIGSDPKSKVAKALSKLEKSVSKCSVASAYDAGACGGLGGQALVTCLDQLAACSYCGWANTILGASVDCDLEDDAIANLSCQ